MSMSLVNDSPRSIANLNIEIPPDFRPNGGTVPRSHQVDNVTVRTGRAGELVHLNPVKAFHLRVRNGNEALWIIPVPPGAMVGNEF